LEEEEQEVQLKLLGTSGSIQYFQQSLQQVEVEEVEQLSSNEEMVQEEDQEEVEVIQKDLNRWSRKSAHQ
jgi:hypothetical protein